MATASLLSMVMHASRLLRQPTGRFHPAWLLPLLVLVLTPRLFASDAEANRLLVTYEFTGRADSYDIGESGEITFRSSFDTWDDTLEFPWANRIEFSSNGKYVFLTPDNIMEGALYSTGEDGFHLMKEFWQGCGGGGFTPDEKYFFIVTDTQGGWPTTYTLQTYRLSGQSLDLATTSGVSYLNAPARIYHLNQYDELIASSRVSPFSPYGFVIFQFDRETERLTLKQQIMDIRSTYISWSDTKEFFVHSFQEQIGSIARDPDGTYREVSSYWGPEWPDSLVVGIDLTPDSKFAVALLGNPRGPVIFSVLPDRGLEYLGQVLVPREVKAQAMTPDGEIFAVSSDDGRVLRTFRFTPKPPYLNELASIELPYVMASMEFFPNYYPRDNAVEPEWNQYVREGGALNWRPGAVKSELARATGLGRWNWLARPWEMLSLCHVSNQLAQPGELLSSKSIWP